jgi:hypothetical protein
MQYAVVRGVTDGDAASHFTFVLFVFSLRMNNSAA